MCAAPLFFQLQLPNVLCVAASTDSDMTDSRSNYGRGSVHAAAPGLYILSTVKGARVLLCQALPQHTTGTRPLPSCEHVLQFTVL